MAKYKKSGGKKKKDGDYPEWMIEKAVAIAQEEKDTWEKAVVYITERVAFKVRDLIRTCYKNYWGIFDKPKDPLTGRDKIWYPLSEEVANSWTDNSDLDQKDIRFHTRPGGNYSMTQLTRQIMMDYFDQSFFGMDLDNIAFEKGITGTSVTKVIKERREGKNYVERHQVNLLNFYIDPTAKSIQDAYRVMERALMFKDEIERMDGWKNTTGLTTEKQLPNFDMEVIKGGRGGNVKSRDVWEIWGKIPNCFFSGKQDDQEEVDGHLIVSGLEAGNPTCHLVEKNLEKDTNGKALKPYEEDWAMRVPGRWYGRGPVEQVMMLQLWINTIVNIRINRSYVSQLGLWKVKRGANITPQTIQRLGANGAVLVSSMDDIEQMVMQDASQASYTDESNIRDIAKRITRTLETVTGEQLPASMTATATSIQASSSKTPFTKIKERSGFFVERLINRHLMGPVIANYNKGDLIRIISTDNDIDDILERVAFYYVEEYQGELELQGKFLSPEQLDIAILQAKEELRQKPELFLELTEELVAKHVDATVLIMNEELDMGSMADKLIMGANLLPEQDRGAMVRTIYDTLGIPFPPELMTKNNQASAIQQIPGNPSVPQEIETLQGQQPVV